MSKEQISVSAPGKIHLLGEHVVVHGKPAIITTIDKRCVVKLFPSENSDIRVTSKNLNASVTVSAEKIHGIREQAQNQWEQYRDSNDASILKSITEDEMDFPVIAIGETLHYFDRNVPSGFSLSIESEVPIGAGLGSSAATAVSVVAAMTSFLGEDIDSNKGVINDIAFLVEQKKHGMPSGGDNAAVCFGGLIWFRKETPDLKIIQPVPFSIPESIAENFLIIDTGRPTESTGEMVAMVRSRYQEDQDSVGKLLHDQERLTRELLAALKSGNEQDIMEIIRLGSLNLQNLGVVSPSVIKLINEIEQAGGVAKICGAGGKTEASGVVLAYHPDKTVSQGIASKHNLKQYDAVLGAEGLREEK
ncbi:MAG: mevalonate kinase [Patescibacteria group bacterium]